MKNLKDMRSSGTFSHKNILEKNKSGINGAHIMKQNSSQKTNNNSNIKSPKIIRPKTQMFDTGIKQNKKKEELGKNSDKKNMQRKKEINEANINNAYSNNLLNNNESVIDDELNKNNTINQCGETNRKKNSSCNAGNLGFNPWSGN